MRTLNIYSALASIGLGLALPLSAQAPAAQADPYPDPIEATQGVITVGVQEFATLPDIAGAAPRVMLLQDEPGTKRLFVNIQTGEIYTVSYDGKTVTKYLDLTEPKWEVKVLSGPMREHGFQSFAIHPQFAQRGAPGYGKLYVWTDVTSGATTDYQPGGGQHIGDNALFEFTARDAAAATYDGGMPRELLRIEDPFHNHNGGRAAFNPLAKPGDADFGLLYFAIADGGSGGDPLNNSPNLASPFGKIFRIDPLGKDGPNGHYGIPKSNPFASDNDPKTLGEIYAIGLRNSQNWAWDKANGRMFVTDIGQNTIEEVDTVRAGGDLGWNVWEASYKYSRAGITAEKRDPKLIYPIAEFDHKDPLFTQRNVAVTGLAIYRESAIPQLRNLVLFGDLPSGEMFYVSADKIPGGGQAPIRRILFNDGSGTPKRFIELIQAKNRQQGKPEATRADLRIHQANDGRVFLINKLDGVIRVLVR